jgi:uncharacterized UBP type Zn finger protein
MNAVCDDLAEIQDPRRKAVRPSGPGCEECLAAGGGWVHLRLCLTCGHVGCCDDSPMRHASAHYRKKGHPVMRSFEPGEAWAWCYAHRVGLAGIRARPGETPRRHLAPPGP